MLAKQPTESEHDFTHHLCLLLTCFSIFVITTDSYLIYIQRRAKAEDCETSKEVRMKVEKLLEDITNFHLRNQEFLAVKLEVGGRIV